MIDLNQQKQKIINVALGFNALILIIGIFYSPKWILVSSLSLNIVLLGTFIILTKYGMLFSGLITANRFARQLNNGLMRTQ